MADRPILFSAPMIRALLDGRKRQTRRVLAAQVEESLPSEIQEDLELQGRLMGEEGGWIILKKPLRFEEGDRLWVRERFNVFAFSQDGEECWPVKPFPTKEHFDEVNEEAVRGTWDIHYAATPVNECWRDEKRYRPSIHMPRWASRLTLIVEGVKVERLQDISGADAKAEGAEAVDRQFDERLSNANKIDFAGCMSHGLGFERLWRSINGPDSWEANPWVVALTFRAIKANIDSPEAKA
jgi:hypothetical protein